MSVDASILMVDRAIQIINILFQSDVPLGVSAISNSLNLPKVTVYRILNTLYNGKLVEKDNEDKYRLAITFIQYGEKVKSGLDLKSLSDSFINELSNATGEAVSVGIRNEESVITINSAEGESSVLVSKLVPTSLLHCAAMGKLFLAHMTDNEIMEYFQIHNTKRTSNTITNYKDFLVEKEKILNTNIAFDNEEYEYGLQCIASPIFNCDKKMIAAVSISGPMNRLKAKGILEIQKHLENTTRIITEKLLMAGI
ncbi:MULTISPECIES: IclR family transcriptional regulator [Clostridium]|uniref:IclR family transcriptional regulator n=2 Tax=Clostridium TaxID=1485 RepID=A0A0E3JNM8_CLOSL|nr:MULTISPECIES: IclR family transcriptional regulator [Clostridium]AKA69479.1 IclR family transcriptional regulator [Clostridium scatologenes]AWI04422.1 hypothetical protein B9W14_07905 [Clostridium drakei]